MTRFDFLLYAIGFLAVGLSIGVAITSVFYGKRVGTVLKRIGDGDLGQEESSI